LKHHVAGFVAVIVLGDDAGLVVGHAAFHLRLARRRQHLGRRHQFEDGQADRRANRFDRAAGVALHERSTIIAYANRQARPLVFVSGAAGRPPLAGRLGVRQLRQQPFNG